MVLPVLHVEAVWIDPDCRRSGGVWWALTDGIAGAVRAAGSVLAWVTTETAHMAKMAEIQGGQPVPGQQWLVPFGKE